MNVRAVGSYIRKQREGAKLSLRGMSHLAGVSIPYLSQIERGLRRPSADILQAIAKALRISAETLYVQAGILEDRPIPDVAGTIMADPFVTERHKQALIQIYEAFREEAAAKHSLEPPVPPAPSVKAGGGAKTKAARSRHPAPLRSSAPTRRRTHRKEV
jgi:transcriptional regulator with XRE-family HTH domain